MQPNTLSQSLLELSDALELLAFAIAQQKKLDNQAGVKEISLIHKKITQATKNLKKNTTQSLITKIKSKHQKGFLQDWLHKKNIYTGKSKPTLKVDNKLAEIAEFLADHYNQLQDFYKQLKRNQNIKKDFVATSKKSSIKYIRKWCNMLHDNKIIDSFYFLDQQTLDIDIAQIHQATYFINGFWLEILLRREIAILLRKNIDKLQSFDILAQVELIKPDKNSSEIDLLIMINQNVYWFECKSGNIGKYYKVFNHHRKLLQLNSTNSFLVVPAFQMHQAKAVIDKSGMSLLYATQLDNQLHKIFF